MSKDNQHPTSDYSSLTKNGDEEQFAVAVPCVQAISMPSTVQVVAPADLTGGYELAVDVDGKPTLIRIPDDGVKQGQSFVAQVIRRLAVSENTFDHNIPRGVWRDGIFSCCNNGICHPMCCLAFWCQPLALGQVMTRMKLNALGKVSSCRKCTSPNPMIHLDSEDLNYELENQPQYWTAFKVLAAIFAAYIAVDQSLSIILTPYPDYETDDQGNVFELIHPNWVYVLMAVQYVVGLAFFLYIFFLIIRTRSYVRGRYDIPESTCNGCEDCCCALWFPFCTITQMARHTANYEVYPASCCTDTGLSEHEPAME